MSMLAKVRHYGLLVCTSSGKEKKVHDIERQAGAEDQGARIEAGAGTDHQRQDGNTGNRRVVL
jgi:hypothetical protein